MKRRGILFGPVNSRRLGRSLGLELVPKKICSMDCLYCEVGKTTLLTSERAPYVAWEKIAEALEIAKDMETDFDVLTLTGSGEPTLNIHFEEAVSHAKKLIKKPVSVLTNSTTIGIPSVREALGEADLVLASLDSARESSFRLVNRPVREVNLREIIEGLRLLKEIMKGELWLEILLVKGINDSEEDLVALREAIEYIRPHKVQINTVVRPPAYSVAKPLSFEELEWVRDFLAPYAEIITPRDRPLTKETRKGSLEEDLLDYLSRRPASLAELKSVFSEENLLETLEKLSSEGKIQRITHLGELFFKA